MPESQRKRPSVQPPAERDNTELRQQKREELLMQRFDNIKLEKGMYHEAGRSFTQVLEKLDPSEQYRGTAMEGLDAFQR